MAAALEAQSKQFLANDRSVRFVQVQYTDPCNVTRARIFPISYFRKHLLDSESPAVAWVTATFGAAYLSLAPGFGPQGEKLLVLDFATTSILPYQPGYVSVLGFVKEKVPRPGRDQVLTTEYDFCPRSVLKRITEEAKAAGVEFLVGFETEFFLLTSTSPITSVGNLTVYSGIIGLPTASKQQKVLEEISDCLEASGIEVQMFHPESAAGQYEISTGPLPPLQAADALVRTQQTVYGVANKHGLRATLAPQVVRWTSGNASHVHISIRSTSGEVKTLDQDQNNLTSLESSFLSGLLTSFRSIVALTLPTPASYTRVADGMWSGGTYVAWGTDNRESPIRLCCPENPKKRNFEWKLLDATANPYFGLAGILAAGLDGVKHRAPLTIHDCPDSAAADLSDQQRCELGIKDRVPKSLMEAREVFKGSKVIKEAFGEDFVKKYLSINETMAHELEKPESEDGRLELMVQSW